MGSFNIELPDSLHEEIRRLAERENISVDRLIALAVAEKIAALDTEAYLQGRAARGDRAAFEQALEKVADVSCPEEDAL